MKQPPRKQQRQNDYDETTRRDFRVQRKQQQQKLMRNLERALRSKDYGKLIANSDEF
jgi:hypothetical protein